VIGAPSVLIIVQNLPVPFDRRVWLECRASRCRLRGFGGLPEGPGDPAEEVIDGITVYKYSPARGGNGATAFVREYFYSLTATAWLCNRRGDGSTSILCRPAIPRHFLDDSAGVPAPRCEVCLRPPRPMPGALRIPIRQKS